MIQTTLNDHYISGLGDDTVTGTAASFEVIEDMGGSDTIMAAGGMDDLIISRSGGDTITL